MASTTATAMSIRIKSEVFAVGCTGPNHRRMVASAPGPAMKGNASGNTEMSLRWRASAASSLEVRVPD